MNYKRNILTTLLAFFIFWECPAADPITAAKDLIGRVTPEIESKFTIQIIPGKNGKDVFEISADGDQVLLKGNNAIAIASAYNWYLKYYCNIHYSWVGKQLNFPKVLPVPKKSIKQIIEPDLRVYMNYCTFNYSASWWNWERWQREIDFMAMNGINMPLSVVGLEGVWYNSLLKVGFTDEEARTFLVGPAFLAWQWMTNIESYGGPLPKNWIDEHVALGKKIINRQVELGMKPIQQGFTGSVPVKFKEKFPQAKIQFAGGGWARESFLPTAQLDPLDPLFKKFGTIFLNETKKMFGTYGFYAGDPFHEGEPPQKDTTYLSEVGKQITQLIVDFDSNAKWVMQSWSLRKEIATAVPKERLLILDLDSRKIDRNSGYWGYDFVVGNLHNFGGRINLHGDLSLIASNQYLTVKKKYPNAIGSGLFMEGINQNPVYYDLAFEIPMHSKNVDLTLWLHNYAKRRYGYVNGTIDSAWQLLLQGPYKKGTNGIENSSIIAARPALQVKKSGPNTGFHIPYPPLLLNDALQMLLSVQHDAGQSDAYRFDIVDIQRQVLSNLGQKIHMKAAASFAQKDKKAFSLHSKRFLDLLADVDKLIGTRPEYSFNEWVKDARSWGKNQAEKDLYELNASMLVTWWGSNNPKSTSTLFDYSWREWSGLISGYYLPRWQKFYAMLSDNLNKGTDYPEEGLTLVWGREGLRANSFYSSLADAELEWIKKKKNLTAPNAGKELVFANELVKKYQPLLQEYEGK